jgi:hypothetical protein
MQQLIELVRAGQIPLTPAALRVPIWLFETVRLLTDQHDFSTN